MTVVIDVGCARHHTSFSIERLVEMFHPDMLYGFDPNDTARTEVVDGCEVEVFRAAAWTSNGTVPFRYEEITSRVDEGAADHVPAVDLATFIDGLDHDDIILKVDAEGAEYDLLEHLIRTKADRRLKVAWIEWHLAPSQVAARALRRRRNQIGYAIACGLREWEW